MTSRIRRTVDRLADASCRPTDSEEERLRKGIFSVAVVVYTLAGLLWGITYWLLGERLPALIPLGYSLAALVMLAVLFRTRRYRALRNPILSLWLALPFLLHWSLGGFTASSGVALWAFGAPLGALMFVGIRQAVWWFAAFFLLLVLAGAAEPVITRPPTLPSALVTAFFTFNLVGVTAISFGLLRYFFGRLQREQERSDRLLLNVLPAPIAQRLKQGETLIADRSEEVTVVFADLVDFTPTAERLPPEEVVALLDQVFTAFDRLAEERGLEKIKTVGDAYMVVAGLPESRRDHAEAAMDMAMAMMDTAHRMGVDLRIGMDTGPVVAGVIGRRKFSYDLWGDTVNTASRMESQGVPGRIQLTERTRERLDGHYRFQRRPEIVVKGKGPMRPYLLVHPGRSVPTPG